jgi:hypothetical protein
MPQTNRGSSGQTDNLVASAARTTTGNSGLLGAGWGAVSSIRAQLNVTAASGTTPTLDVVIEDTLDGTNFNPVVTFAQKTTTGREVINATIPFSDQMRVRWTVGGTTPSFTFAVDAYTE